MRLKDLQIAHPRLTHRYRRITFRCCVTRSACRASHAKKAPHHLAKFDYKSQRSHVRSIITTLSMRAFVAILSRMTFFKSIVYGIYYCNCIVMQNERRDNCDLNAQDQHLQRIKAIRKWTNGIDKPSLNAGSSTQVQH